MIDLLINSLLGLSLSYTPLQFPENREYESNVDTGFKQYETISIHNTGQYVLTFDDGPHPTRTTQILDILKAYQVKATFFVVTSKLNSKTFPIFKRILDEGHIAASHHHAHDNNNKISAKEFKLKLKSSLTILKRYYALAGHIYNKIYYRFPYAAYGENPNYHHINIIKEVSQDLFSDNCINFVFWDVDSGDWIPGLKPKAVFNTMKSFQEGGDYTSFKVKRVNGKKVIVPITLTNNRPTKGGVILLHDIQKRTIKATELYLKYLEDNKLDVISLDEVEEFSYKDKDCKFK